MLSCRTLLKCALVALVLVAAAESGSADEKLATCCKKYGLEEITEPITGYMIQKANPPCIQAIIFQTESGLFCRFLNAKWVREKVLAFERAKAKPTQASPTRGSLLSIITSAASPPSSSPSSSSATA